MLRQLFFATLVTLIALSASPSVSAGVRHGIAAAGIFQGNPNVTISAIDTSGGIATSRTTCKTPCFIHVSGSPITATGTATPFEDLSFAPWNFDDAPGTEIFTNYGTNNGTAGVSVNANNGQTGPEAAYVYRQAGTYHPKLIVAGNAGGGGVITAPTITHPGINVTAFSPATTWYWDAASSGGDGTTAALSGTHAAFNNLTNLGSLITAAAVDTQFYLARGSHWVTGGNWTGTTDITISPSAAVRISPTPSSVGANPIIETSITNTGAHNAVLAIGTYGGQAVSDIVFSNIDWLLTGNPSGNSTFFSVLNSRTTVTMSWIYFDNCNFSSQVSVAQGTGSGAGFGNSKHGLDGFGIWGGSINSLSGDLGFGSGFFGGAYDWTFIVGLSNINGRGSSNGSFSALNHHIYADIHNHGLFRWISAGSGAENASRNFSIKVDFYPPPNSVLVSAYSSGTGGTVRLTVNDTSQFTNGANIYIEEITGSGAVDVTSPGQTTGQGIWVGSLPGGGDTTHIDLVGTVFNAGHVYTGGNVQPTGQADYWLIDGNNVTGTARSFDVNNNFGNSFAGWQSSTVIQNNIIHDQSINFLTFFPIALSLTYRDNNHWNNTGGGTVSFSQGRPQNTSAVFRLYRNKFYLPALPNGADQDSAAVSFYASPPSSGNAPGSWTNPQTFTDNIIQDMRASAAAVTLSGYAASAAWTVNRNQYYAPNATASKLLYNGTTQTTFATWTAAGFDANGSVANPNWSDPANGRF